MSATSSPNRDVESQLLLTTDAPPRHRWSMIFLLLRFKRILLSSIADTQAPSDGFMIDNTANEGYTRREIPENEEPLLDAHPDCTNESIVSINAELQYENLAKITKGNDLKSLHEFGGVQGAAVALGTDLTNGIPGNDEDLSSRRTKNQPFKAQHPTQGFFKLFLKSCNSWIILLLFVSAVLSIGFGIKEKGARAGWREGAIIFAAIIFIVLLSSIRDYKHENSNKLQWQIQSDEKRPKVINVVRGGTEEEISPDDVVYGDVVDLRKGCEVPGDGLFISGEFLKLDCGTATIDEKNPFLYHGAKVIDGHGRMLVVSVGMNTSLCEKMSQVTHLAPTKTRLPAQLDKAGNIMQVAGLVISILILVIVFLRFMLKKAHPHDSQVPDIKGKPISVEFFVNSIKNVLLKPHGNVSFLTTSLIMLVVGLAERVPFIVTFAIIRWNYKVLSNKALAQEPLACVRMGSVTVIFTDLNGVLTLRSLEVDMFYIDEEVISECGVTDAVREALCNGISAPFLTLQSHGSSTRDPLLSWAKLKLGLELEDLKRTYTTTDAMELNSWEETSKVLIWKNIDDGRDMSIHWSGPAETILSMCSFYYDHRGTKKSLHDSKRSAFQHNIEQMRSKNLQTVAFAYKRDDSTTNEDTNLVWIGLIGLKCFCSTETRKATKAFKDAGIKVVLISEEDVSLLQARALEFGLADDSDGIINCESFGTFADEERMSMLDNISVIGNCRLYDNLRLVKCFKEKGHVVAMVGARITNAPALKEANVGIAMGIQSSKLAKDSSDIIICDESFNFLATIVKNGRCIYHNIQKYVLVEVTVFVVWALMITTTTFLFGDAPVTTIQWFWVHLLVTVPGGFALLAEPPRMELIDKPLVRPTDPFFTKVMRRNMITQALFQVTILVILSFASRSLEGIDKKICETVIFNIFVLFQVFNLFNAREPNTKNIFKGILRNIWFVVAVTVILVLQFTFIEIAHMKFGNARLNGVQWGICVLIGMLSWLTDFTTKIIWSLFEFCLTSSHSGSADRTHLDAASVIELPLISSDSTAVP